MTIKSTFGHRSKCLSGGNVRFGRGRTNGQRIHDQRLYGVDPEIVSTPYSYDNNDVDTFVVDPNCDYSVEPRRNFVRSYQNDKTKGSESNQDNEKDNEKDTEKNSDGANA